MCVCGSRFVCVHACVCWDEKLAARETLTLKMNSPDITVLPETGPEVLSPAGSSGVRCGLLCLPLMHCCSGSSLLPSKQRFLGSLVLHRPPVGNWNISGEKAFPHTWSQVKRVDFRTSMPFPVLLQPNPWKRKPQSTIPLENA